MVSYVGFSTIETNAQTSSNLSVGADGSRSSNKAVSKNSRKFKLTDEQLVIRDFINALNIQQGQKVGNPGYGTTLWSFVFEPNTSDVRFKLESEIRRVASLDPRMVVNSVETYFQEHGILIQVETAVAPFNQAQLLKVYFDNETSVAALL